MSAWSYDDSDAEEYFDLLSDQWTSDEFVETARCQECLREVPVDSPAYRAFVDGILDGTKRYCSETCRDRAEEHARTVEARRGAPEAQVWDWLGGYVDALKPRVAELLHGEDEATRRKAFEALDSYRQKRSKGAQSDLIEQLSRLDDSSTRDRYDRQELRGPSSPRPNAERIRNFLEGEARKYGFSFEDFVAPFPRGRLSTSMSGRYDALALSVAKAHQAGARLEAIGRVIDRPKQRIAELKDRARGLAG